MRYIRIWLLSTLSLGCLCAQAVSLKEVYQEAKTHDPTFQIAYHTWLSAQGDPDIALSSLLPQIDLSGDRSFTHYDLSTHTSFGASAHSYGITIDQTLFDWHLWKTYRAAKVGQKMALITLRIAAEDLLYRTTSAYFDVLTSIQSWQTQKKLFKAYARQYEQTKHKFDAGTATRADLFDAKAQADSAKSTLISAKATMDNSVASLYAITGTWHHTFQALTPNLTLKGPMPNHAHAWEKLALAQNMALEYSRLAVKQAHINVQKELANHLPSITMTGNFTRSSAVANGANTDVVAGNLRSILFTASQPILHGGGLIASDKQAQENLKVAKATRLQSERSAIQGAFSSFLNLKASIDSVKANRKAVESSRIALKTSRENYAEGLNTLTDVLFAISTWNTANIAYITTRYNYLLNTLKLKQAVGALGSHDLAQIDGLLTQTIHYPDEKRKHASSQA